MALWVPELNWKKKPYIWLKLQQRKLKAHYYSYRQMKEVEKYNRKLNEKGYIFLINMY